MLLSIGLVGVASADGLKLTDHSVGLKFEGGSLKDADIKVDSYKFGVDYRYNFQRLTGHPFFVGAEYNYGEVDHNDKLQQLSIKTGYDFLVADQIVITPVLSYGRYQANHAITEKGNFYSYGVELKHKDYGFFVSLKQEKMKATNISDTSTLTGNYAGVGYRINF